MRVPLPRKHPTVATRASRDLPSRYASGLRVVIVTLGLALAGMAAGGLTAILFVAVFNLLTTGHVPVDVAIVVAPGAIGGALGLIIGPLLAWTLMRSVPIGLGDSQQLDRGRTWRGDRIRTGAAQSWRGWGRYPRWGSRWRPWWCPSRTASLVTLPELFFGGRGCLRQIVLAADTGPRDGRPPNPRLLLAGANARRSRATVFCLGTRGCAARRGSRSAGR